MRNGREPAYDIRRFQSAGGWKTVAVFACARCDEKLEINLTGQPSPEWMEKSAGNRGWDASAWSRGAIRCPTCINGKTKGGSPKEPTMPNDQPAKPVSAAKPVTLATLREPTPQEKQKIRALLDKHFDDGSGVYLDAMSDQKIGGLLDLPHAMVTRLRESAYGPLRCDPEIMALKAELEAAMKAAMAHEAKLDAMQQRLVAIEKKKAA